MPTIEGLERLVKKLNKISSTAVTQSIERACLLVEGTAKELCPVDDGQLRQSITSEMINELTGAVGTNVEYAPYVHQGTGIYAVNGDGRKERWKYQDAKGEWHSTIGQRPNPFLERALDQNKEKILNEVRQEIRRSSR